MITVSLLADGSRQCKAPLTIRKDIRPSLSQIHSIGVNAEIWVRAESCPVDPQGPTLEEVGKEKSNHPDEDNGDHSPDGRLDESSFEYSSDNISASENVVVTSALPLIKKQHRQLREPKRKCRCELRCKECLSTPSALSRPRRTDADLLKYLQPMIEDWQ